MGDNREKDTDHVLHIALHLRMLLHDTHLLFISRTRRSQAETASGIYVNLGTPFSKACIQIVPCPTPYFFEPQMFVLMNMEGRAFIQAQCSTFFFFLVAEGAFFVTRTVYFLKAKNPALSERTRQMQKKLFRSICIQVAIPVLVVIFPILYCGCAIEWYWYHQGETYAPL